MGHQAKSSLRATARPAFTLIELLVVIGIFTILVSLLTLAIQRVRASAARLQCEHNFGQIGIALHSYHNALGSLPPGVSYQNGSDPYPFMSWHVRILPFLDQQPVWDQAQQAFA